MFGIGAAARLGGVSVRTLRYYDEIGLLRPVWVDPSTGYRWYEPGQLHRLHRIVALRDLGVRLAEIALLLDEDLSIDELRGILLLRRAEGHERLAAEAERLARVEARLAQIGAPQTTDYDVVVKATEPEWVLAVTEDLAGLDEIGPAHGRLWPRLHQVLQDRGVEGAPVSVAVERGQGPIRFTAALAVPTDLSYDADGFETTELPGLSRAATTVIWGDPDFNGAFEALRSWISDAGETESGELREVYLDCDGPRDTWVVELELALEPRG
jgi:DNA-binding transcriptional MerR regulator